MSSAMQPRIRICSRKHCSACVQCAGRMGRRILRCENIVYEHDHLHEQERTYQASVVRFNMPVKLREWRVTAAFPVRHASLRTLPRHASLETASDSSHNHRMKRLLHKLFGDEGERWAAEFLKRQGCRILARQHRDRFGEIDIIALDGNQVVFVEVKARRGTSAGQPFEAVSYQKQQKLARAALVWLKKKRRLDQPTRFDVISIVWPEGDESPQIDHYPNAFEAPGTGEFCG